MPMITQPIIHVLTPDLVEITEQVETYRMSRVDIVEAIANVKAGRHKYANDVAYLRRLNFFEDILAALQAVTAAGDGRS